VVVAQAQHSQHDQTLTVHLVDLAVEELQQDQL
jgi:hypothetical protein